MKRLIPFMLILIILTSCRTRTKDLAINEYQYAEIEKIDTNTVVSLDKSVQKIDKIEIKKDQTVKENDGDIIIKGKTDSLKDFNFHNIVDGDTLSDIYISGNADFIIKNRWKQTQKKETEKSESESLNIVAEIARKSVAQSTIKEVAIELKTKDVKVKSTGFSFPIYLIIGGAVIVVILLFWFFGMPKKNKFKI